VAAARGVLNGYVALWARPRVFIQPFLGSLTSATDELSTRHTGMHTPIAFAKLAKVEKTCIAFDVITRGLWKNKSTTWTPRTPEEIGHSA
jgi:hypothetical protein